jgi:Domain of unknown function (DUF4180)
MNIIPHLKNQLKIAEIQSSELIINSADDALNLLGDLYYQGYDKIVMYEHQVTSDFFELKNGMAGEILQKFSNYRMQLSIIGDFEKYDSKSLNDFIYESNKGKHVNFVDSLTKALQV